MINNNQNEIDPQQNFNTTNITNTISAPTTRILNNFNFACRDIRPEYQNTPTQIITNEQLLIDLNSETDPTLPIQPSTTKTTTFTKSTITSTYTTESFTTTTTTTNIKCQHCNQIPAIGRGRLLLQFHLRRKLYFPRNVLIILLDFPYFSALSM